MVFLFLTFLVSVGITLRSKTRKKLILFFFGYYIMSGAIHILLTFKIPGVSIFEIQPDRFIFLFCLAYLAYIFKYERNRKILKEKWTNPLYEIILYGYIIVIYSAFTWHFNLLGLKEYIYGLTKYGNFLVIFLVLKITSDKPLIRGMGQMMIITAAISAVVSLIQFGIDPFFLRWDEMRPAFGSFIRSNGIFANEYTNSYYMINAMVWTLFLVRSFKLRILLVGLFILGVLTSFQRMSWIVMTLVLGIYFLYFKRLNFGWISLTAIWGAFVLSLFVLLFARQLLGSEMVQERLGDGIDSRFGYYDMVLSNIGKKPLFGYGNRDNEVYYHAMLKITRSVDRATGATGSIHNGYLSTLFYFGVPSLVFFVLFIFLQLGYFFRMSKYNILFAIPFLYSILYMVSNLTNSFLFLKAVSLLLAINLGLFSGAIQNRLLPLKKQPK